MERGGLRVWVLACAAAAGSCRAGPEDFPPPTPTAPEVGTWSDALDEAVFGAVGGQRPGTREQVEVQGQPGADVADLPQDSETTKGDPRRP